MGSNETVVDDHLITKNVWISSMLIICSSFMFGYGIISLNSCLVTGSKNSSEACYSGDDDGSQSCPIGTIFDDLNLSTIEVSFAVSLAVIGAWVGALLGSHPVEEYGRKSTLLWNNIFYIVGGIVSGLGSIPALYIGRFVTGLGVGISSSAVPVLLSEIATDTTRGRITCLHPSGITCGIFMCAIVSYGFVTYVDHGWQYVEMLTGAPGVVMLVFQRWIPESPKWLLSKQNDSVRAANVLHYLRVDASSASIQTEIEATKKQEADGNKNNDDEATWVDVFKMKRAVSIGVGLMVVQTMTGANTVFYYSTTIFGIAGFNESILGTVLVGLINFVTCVYASTIVDHVGRKTLLMGGTSVMFVCLSVMSLVLWLGDSLGDDTQGVIAVVAMMLFIFGFSIGLGSAAWVVLAEVMPTRLRSKAYSLFVSVNWCNALLVGLLTLTAIDGLGNVHAGLNDDQVRLRQKTGCGVLYFIFLIITGISLIWMNFYVPETKGKSPEELMALIYDDSDDLEGVASSNPTIAPGKSSYYKANSSLNAPLITDDELSDNMVL